MITETHAIGALSIMAGIAIGMFCVSWYMSRPAKLKLVKVKPFKNMDETRSVGLVLHRDPCVKAFELVELPDDTTSDDFQGEKVYMIFDKVESVNSAMDQLQRLKDHMLDKELMELSEGLVRDSGHASVSSLQRVFSIGYGKASDIMSRLESAGVVTPPNSAGTRQVINRC